MHLASTRTGHHSHQQQEGSAARQIRHQPRPEHPLRHPLRGHGRHRPARQLTPGRPPRGQLGPAPRSVAEAPKRRRAGERTRDGDGDGETRRNVEAWRAAAGRGNTRGTRGGRPREARAAEEGGARAGGSCTRQWSRSRGGAVGARGGRRGSGGKAVRGAGGRRVTGPGDGQPARPGEGSVANTVGKRSHGRLRGRHGGHAQRRVRQGAAPTGCETQDPRVVVVACGAWAVQELPSPAAAEPRAALVRAAACRRAAGRGRRSPTGQTGHKAWRGVREPLCAATQLGRLGTQRSIRRTILAPSSSAVLQGGRARQVCSYQHMGRRRRATPGSSVPTRVRSPGSGFRGRQSGG